MRNDPTDPFAEPCGRHERSITPSSHTIAELDFAVKNAPEQAATTRYDLHNLNTWGGTNSPVGLSAFLAAPWFEPLNSHGETSLEHGTLETPRLLLPLSFRGRAP